MLEVLTGSQPVSVEELRQGSLFVLDRRRRLGAILGALERDRFLRRRSDVAERQRRRAIVASITRPTSEESAGLLQVWMGMASHLVHEGGLRTDGRSSILAIFARLLISRFVRHSMPRVRC
jgi:hypothetical protein